jgi:predicted enzyme related to lactoylglutathione lyase
MGCPIVRFKLAANDAQAARNFYSQVMDWDFGEPQPDIAGSIDTGWADDITVSGTLTQDRGSIQPGFVAAIRLDDLAAAVAKSTELDGTTIMAPTLHPTGVTVAIIRSPGRVTHTLIQQ